MIQCLTSLSGGLDKHKKILYNVYLPCKLCQTLGTQGLFNLLFLGAQLIICRI
jgi:hypothetical protein